jgi:hypothetical protein
MQQAVQDADKKPQSKSLTNDKADKKEADKTKAE